jgi:hypothetical protein
MALFSWGRSDKKLSAQEIVSSLPGTWSGPGKVYTPAGTQNYRVELTLAAVGATGESPALSGKMISFFSSGSNLETPIDLKLEKEVWSLSYIQTNVHGTGKLSTGKLEFLQKDPTGKTSGQTLEIWNFLSPGHLFIETFVLSSEEKREPFLKIILQKT